MANNDIDVGFLIKDAFKSIVDDPGYIALFILPLIVYIVALVHIFFTVGDLFSIGQQIQDQTYFQTNILSMLQDKMLLLLGMLLIYGTIGIIFYATAMAGLIKKVELKHKNTQMNFSEALSFGFKFSPRFIGAMLLWVLVTLGPFIGIFSLVILGVVTNSANLVCLSTLLLLVIAILVIYIYFRLALFMQACVIEDIGIVECMKRSWMITKGNVLLIFVTALILGIIAMIFTVPFTVASNAGIPYIASVGSILSFIIVGPISAIAFTLLYLKLIRKPVPPPNYPPVQNQYGTNPPPNYPQ